MKIIDKRKQLCFDEIEAGECFFDTSGELCMKVLNVVTEETFVLDLGSGKLFPPTYGENYTIVNPTLEVE